VITAPNIDSVIDQIRDSVGSVETARTLPPECYTQDAFYEFERDAIFGHSWLYLCHQSEIPNAGDYVSVTMANEPLIVTRDKDMSVHALSAICRHRSFPVERGQGNAKFLRCPYHSWTYGLDGRLIGAPDMAPGHALADLRANTCLPSFQVEIWNGFIFANFDSNAPPLAPTLGRLNNELEGYHLDDLVVARTVVLQNLPWNWKNMLENALDAYHTSYIHKGYHEQAPARLVQFAEFLPEDNAVLRFAPLLKPGGGFLNEDGTAAFPILPGVRGEQLGRILYASVPPALFMSVKPDNAMIFRVAPESAGSIALTATWLFAPTTIEMPEFEELMNRQLDFFDIVNGQDMDANARTYEGLNSRFAVRGPYSAQESSLPQFNEWLYRRYAAHSPSAAKQKHDG
jgi:phenylpropionate dioxygenase-like ring-hydroxylating dioxygenase large terminal subunit